MANLSSRSSDRSHQQRLNCFAMAAGHRNQQRSDGRRRRQHQRGETRRIIMRCLSMAGSSKRQQMEKQQSTATAYRKANSAF